MTAASTLAPAPAPPRRAPSAAAERCDAVVIGAGFGGLGAALRLALEGRRVVVCERLDYPGGCASTFTRGGRRFESGATLFAGLGPDGLFTRWIAALRLDVQVEHSDPVLELRTPDLELPVPPDRAALHARLAALPGAPRRGLARYLDHQTRVADALWALLDRPELLPPLSLSSLAAHARRLPQLLPVARDVGRSLQAVLRRYGVDSFEPLRLFLDAQCQITVQCPAAEAEAPFALAAVDYAQRGAGHVVGGIGVLARALCGAIEARGGELRFHSAVRRVAPDGAGYRVETRTGALRAPLVVANLLPSALERVWTPGPRAARALSGLQRRVEDGWGACMLYLALGDGAALPRGGAHLQLVQDPRAPLHSGNHLFASLSAADGSGQRALTVSTHAPLCGWRPLADAARADAVAAVQERMRAGLRALAPEWVRDVRAEHPASPRTFARFVGRPEGFVGGVPRRVGRASYRGLGPRLLAPGLALVGDSAFLGQSALACAAGGWRTSEALLGRRAPR